MKVYNNLHITTSDDCIFDVPLNGELVIVEDISGSGKTFLFNTIKEMQLVPKSCIKEGDTSVENIVLINVYNKKDLKDLPHIKGKLIIIDNADIILTQEMADFISRDINNQYLIYARSMLEFHVTSNYYAYFEREGKTFTLKYRFPEEGWY